VKTEIIKKMVTLFAASIFAASTGAAFGEENLTGEMLTSVYVYHVRDSTPVFAIEGQYVKDAKTMDQLLSDIHYDGTKPSIDWKSYIAVVFVNSTCRDSSVIELLSLKEHDNKLVLAWRDLAESRDAHGLEVHTVWVHGRYSYVTRPEGLSDQERRKLEGYPVTAVCGDQDQLLVARIPRKLFELYQLATLKSSSHN